ncbi:MAG TPA: type II toxin-antitoxin system RelE/ParE family toxin [Epulopiscium sp.]|nr:type II toxin-antitoxin system RelE/ParE family toxin [Candidatus Epulonipiscium sp.]
MAWTIRYLKEAERDLLGLDHSQRLHVIKAIQKVSGNPVSSHEGGYGKPLSNNSTTRLAGYYKIKLLRLGIRVIYGIIKENEIMTIVVVSVRDDSTAYKLADKRIR